jgi:Flp pilus assembly protein TadD
MASALTFRAPLRLLPLGILASLTIAHAQGPTSSQPRELHGRVDRADGTPFGEGALVKVENDHGGMAGQVLTDSRSNFDFVPLQKARYTVTVHANGFLDASTDVDLDTVPRAYIRITLHELPRSGTPETTSAAPAATVSVNDLNVPQAAQVEFEKGRSLLLDKQKASDSIKPFLKAIQIAPSYSQAYFLLGTAYMDMGKLSDAETALGKAISLNDKLDTAYLELGSCLIEEKKFAEAEKPLLRGLELAPDASRGHYDLGRAYYTLNRLQEAEPHARKAVALEPDFAEAHILLGNVLLRLRDGTHALAEFQEYLRLAPHGTFAGPTQELVKKLQGALSETH